MAKILSVKTFTNRASFSNGLKNPTDLIRWVFLSVGDYFLYELVGLRRSFAGKLTRITINPNVCQGQATIRGMRITVAFVLKLMASGMTHEEILAAYPELGKADLQQVIEYAAWLASESHRPSKIMAGYHQRIDEDQRMKKQKLYPLALIYPLGPPEGLRFSACLKIRCSLFKVKSLLFGQRF
jgi:uncharacterized protein (DUF433 family)